MRPLLGVLILLLVAAAALGQSGMGKGGSFASAIQTGAPSFPEDGQTWVRKTDFQTFIYSDSLGKWLGELVLWEYGHANAVYSGFLQMNPRMLSDTTTSAEVGCFADGTMRIMRAFMVSSVAVPPTGSSTYVYADQSVLMKFDWANANYVVVVPTADSTQGWIAPQARVVVPSGAVVSLEQVTGTTAVSTPRVVIYLREEVTP